MDVDVLIVGLGPAGATVLSKLAQFAGSEISILAIDHRQKPGFPVQCGEFMPSPEEMAILMPDVPKAQAFFTFDKQFISTYTRSISFFSPARKIIRTPFRGYTLYRGNWNAHLIEVGKGYGADVWTSACAVDMTGNKITVVRDNSKSIQIAPRVIVGADGVSSRIAKWTGLAEKRSDKHFVIVKQHLMTEIENEFDSTDVQMFFGEKYAPGAYAWIIPKSRDTANVGAGVRLPMLKKDMTVSKALSNLINIHPTASQILKNAHIKHTIAGIVPVGPPFQKTVELKTKTLIVGDAACQVVSSVGGGIPPSMVAGSIAASSIIRFLAEKAPLSDYQTEWRVQMLKMFKSAYKLR
ncbi:MAG: geranylgeranyl reductase family protein, partial [Candidatus Hodarchaeota archaeon]